MLCQRLQSKWVASFGIAQREPVRVAERLVQRTPFGKPVEPLNKSKREPV